MGYDIHIVRTEDWLDADTKPITKEQVDKAVESASDLEWSQTDYVLRMNKEGATTRYYAIEWKNRPCFIWLEHEITCSSPKSDDIVMRMVELANSLDAYTVGDDGEHYTIKKSLFGKKKLIISH